MTPQQESDHRLAALLGENLQAATMRLVGGVIVAALVLGAALRFL